MNESFWIAFRYTKEDRVFCASTNFSEDLLCVSVIEIRFRSIRSLFFFIGVKTPLYYVYRNPALIIW